MTGRALVITLVALAIPTPASAFNDADKFGAAAIEGGGGGRYFSGSVRDGYTCAVCHMGGEQPEIEITGLPEGGYVPGETYDVELVLPDDAAVTSAVIELASATGEMMGSLDLGAAPGRNETCLVDGAEVDAAHQIALPAGREVIALDACGATRVSFSWRAPNEPQGPVWFHAAVVGGDASSDPNGDGVRVYTEVLPVQGASATSAEVASGCSASGGGAPVGAAILWMLLVVTRARASARRRV